MTEMLRKAFKIAPGYVLVSTAIMLLGSTVASAGCGSRTSKALSDNAGDTIQSNLTWVKTNHPIYIAVQGRGVFRLNLNSNKPEPLGIHKGVAFEDFKISPSGRYLLYQLASATSESFYIYDLDLEIEQKISGLPRYSHITASPNNRWLAAIPRPGSPPVVWLQNLKDGKVKQFSIPSASENDLVFGSEWSIESSLLFEVRQNRNEVFWSFTPETEKFLQVSGVRTAPPKIAYFQGSKEIQTVCEWCSTQHDLLTASVAGGTVFATRDSLVFRKSGTPDRAIATVPPAPDPAPGQPVLACGPEGIRLAGVFDNQYLLFSVDESVELYSVVENRTALLPIPPYSLIAWQ